ncbi:Phage (Mu-like) virion morphogenesis protein [Rhodovulum sp. P5]|uniref:minor head protein and DNA pilot n=1 Tax=Rhodovulum phage vB_RhkS_P1 TaxID=1873452 RepID=UPI00080AB1D2|nr:phage minor head protein [Rhodovulum sp. P5]YP_009285920.1 minor head protein and DNA pilot [Rhodovulum phage vB_RhkS_P1]ANT39906.1 virion morphogenesis protein [Rhodovulum phage vB_RhkS_P1]ARE38974.1 Phage (Mu-like) virion morphogenesis protein [Rhodovulum sp. P5]
MAIDLEPLPHLEAIDYFRSKGFAATGQRFHHLDMWREEHARNFVVAKAMNDDVLATIRAELQRALEEGRTLAEFQADLEPALQKAGWWGKSLMEDPQTGEMVEVQLGSPRRLRTIYDTNMRTAHAAGHWARIQRTKQAFPYLHYIQVERPSKREEHARFHDHIWRVDDPIWRRIYPPNGWYCGCHVIQRTEGWMRRNGRSVSPPLDLEEEDYPNKRTGEVVKLPKGVHPGFDTNPGATWLDIADRVDEVFGDLDGADRATLRGQVQALRLRQTALRRETLIVNDEDWTPAAAGDAAADTPDRVSVDAVLGGSAATTGGLHLVHSHLADSPLSVADLRVLAHPRTASIAAVSPGGAVWRAEAGAELLDDQLAAFARAALPVIRAETAHLSEADRGHVVHHALALYLERRGAIRYRFSVTGQLRDLFARHADLIERLSS